MKISIVPAQITTVEDRVAGNLGLNQLLLLVAPIFTSSAIFVIFPPIMQPTVVKLTFITLLSIICSALAIRFRGVLLLHLLISRVRYNVRPRYYVSVKNDGYMRIGLAEYCLVEVDEPPLPVANQTDDLALLNRLSPTEIIAVEQMLHAQSKAVRFVSNKKGGLRVLVTEVKSES